MKTNLQMAALLLVSSAVAWGQAAPAAIEVPVIPVSGSLHYALNYSINDWLSSGNQLRSLVSGIVGYSNASTHLPFSMNYGGGYSSMLNGPPAAGSVFQNLSLLQGYERKNWGLSASDSVGYFFETPTTGITGVPGSGDLTGGTTPTTPSDQSILLQNVRSLNNDTSLGLHYRIDYATEASIRAFYGMQRFIDGFGIESNQDSLSGTLSRRVSARNSVAGSYSYTKYMYKYQFFSDQVSTASLSFSRRWNAQISSNVGAGPQWISSTGSQPIPSSIGISIHASLTDVLRFGNAGLSYSRGTSNGSGLLLGSEVDNLTGSFSKALTQNLQVGLYSSYMRTTGLSKNGVTNAEFGGAQLSQRLSRYFSVYASYTGIDQSTSSLISGNAVSQFIQVLSGGISFSPRPIHIGN